MKGKHNEVYTAHVPFAQERTVPIDPVVCCYGCGGTSIVCENDRANQLAATYDPRDGLLHWQRQMAGQGLTLNADEIALLINVQGKTVQALGQISGKDIAGLRTMVIGAISAHEQLPHIYTLTVKRGDGSVALINYRIMLLPIVENGRTMAFSVVGLSREDIEKAQQHLLQEILLNGLLAVLLSAIGGYWLAIRALRPMRMMTRTANEISETDLSRRIQLKSKDELGELAATFDRMLSRLEMAFDNQRQFVADASHELRTPLTIVSLEVNRVLSHGHNPEEYEQAFTVIQAENEHMVRLVNDLLTLAQIDAGQTPLKLAAVDLSDLALEAVERLAMLARKKGVELSIGDLPEINVPGDRLRLLQVLTNLIENALKYTCGTGCHVWVEMSELQTEQKKWGVVRVEDDGPGIASEHMPHLFDRFYQIDKVCTSDWKETSCSSDHSNESTAGSGLGLAVVQGIVQAHGGKVKVHSHVGHGSIFEVWLPLAVLQCQR